MAKQSGFSIVLRETRKRRKLSQEDLAEILGVSVETVSKLERGVSKPRLGTLERMSQKLKIPLVDLVGYASEGKPHDLQRTRLETAITELMRKADTKTLRLMVEQFEVALKHQGK